MSSKKRVILAGLVCALLPLASCANTPFAEQFERSLAADPRLSDTPASNNPTVGQSSSSLLDTTIQLPASFPAEIPRYPGAELIEVAPEPAGTATATDNQALQTRWKTADSASQVQQFYRSILQSNDWRILAPTPDRANTDILAERNGIRLTVSLATANAPTSAAGTEFTLGYESSIVGETPINGATSGAMQSSSPNGENASNSNTAMPQPGDPTFIGPLLPSGGTPQPTSPAETSTASSQTFRDISQAPEELRSYIEDLAKLGVFTSNSNTAGSSSNSGNASNSGSSSNSASQDFKPNAIITRREYARWLVTANNVIYRDRPAQKIRLGVSSDDPIYRDVPRTDPDFAAIQGLAAAGLIPSPLSGDATTVTFRPDAPLTRENLILWKVPVDTRQTLPNATVQSIQDTWGFQDTARIEPRALRAVLADFQNGDLSNIRRAFGYTTLFQPKKTVTRAEAAAVLWYFGSQGDGISAKDAE